ncbi:hypothetical protein [Sphingomonas montana]|uniref:hypothetical protein n=1 Tax=Sphingomonas montana TaxID=1843236 RepID=UPI00101AE125|nr:hypothetical protein [Sphingomonas montana]
MANPPGSVARSPIVLDARAKADLNPRDIGDGSVRARSVRKRYASPRDLTVAKSSAEPVDKKCFSCTLLRETTKARFETGGNHGLA